MLICGKRIYRRQEQQSNNYDNVYLPAYYFHLLWNLVLTFARSLWQEKRFKKPAWSKPVFIYLIFVFGSFNLGT